MTGGLKGYSFGMVIDTSYVPPSYGVPSGPLNEPRRLVMLSLTVSAKIWDFVSARISARSFAIRRALCPAILLEYEAIKSALRAERSGERCGYVCSGNRMGMRQRTRSWRSTAQSSLLKATTCAGSQMKKSDEQSQRQCRSGGRRINGRCGN